MNLAQGLPQSGSGSYGYSYTVGGAISTISEPTGRSLTPIYDSAYRLLSETLSRGSANGTISYSLDGVGNRISRSSTVAGVPSGTANFDLDDRLVGLSWDANGNLLSDGTRVFTYDSRNRLTSFHNNSASAFFVVDGLGERVSRTANGVTTGYLVDDLSPTGYPQVVEEVSGGAVSRRYTYGPSRISMTSLSSNTTSYYLYDISGNVRALTDATGNITDSYEYDSYGDLLAHEGSTANDYLYRGERFDDDSSLYYLRARYYDPMSGRFITADEFEGREGDPRSLHRYSYGKANPLSWSDPTGFDAEEVGIALAPSAKAVQFFIVSVEFGGESTLVAPGPLFTPGPFVEGTLTGALGYIAACLIVRGVSGAGLLDGVDVNPLLRTGIGAFDTICQASLPFIKSPKKPPLPTPVPAPAGPRGSGPPIPGFAPNNPCKTPPYFVGTYYAVFALNTGYDPGCFEAHHSPQWAWAQRYQSSENLRRVNSLTAPAISLTPEEHYRITTMQRGRQGAGNMYLQIIYDGAEVQQFTGAPALNVELLVLLGFFTWFL